MPPPHSFAQKFIHGSILNRSWSGAAQAIGLASSFLTLHALSVSQFGLYQLILSAVAIADTFSTRFFDFLVVNDISRALSDGKKSVAKRLFLEMSWVKFALGIAVTFVLFFGSEIVADSFGKGQEAVSYIKIAAMLIFIRALSGVAINFFSAVVSFRAFGLTTIEETVKLAIVSTFFFFAALNIREVLMASVVSSAFAAAFIIFPFAKEYKEFFKNTKTSRQLLLPALVKVYGFWIIIQYAINNARKNVFVWIIRAVLNNEAVAFYTLATNLRALVLEVLPHGTFGLLAWEVGNQERLRYIFLRSMKYALWAGLLVAVISAIAVPVAVGLIFPKYQPAMPLFIALIFSLPLIGASRIQEDLLLAMREQKLLAARAVSSIVLSSAALVVFLPIFGILAVAMQNTGSYLFRFLFYHRNLIKKYPYLKFGPMMFLSFGPDDRAIFRRGVGEVKSFFKSKLWTNAPK